MRLTKQQVLIADVLANGGYIWLAAGRPYLARKDKDGRVKSEVLNDKTFKTMAEHGVITRGEDGKWKLS